MQTDKNLTDRKIHRAPIQLFNPKGDFAVREALIRADLIGGCNGLIPAQPPKAAIEARLKHVNAAKSGPADERPIPPRVKKMGGRPGRNSQKRGAGNRLRSC
ncbi:hypothetical protein R5W24_000229 [Gemmata sp. JC717]|uniref:hypothetical protein n=1 Tax=Gemmata algarum TaxID=2975278 RepID=UPI0021BB8AD6|nr:hypothetical protein [Gemmata algarum]MDY3551154.1 hypothetical protein [Gemmata algarum]